MPYIEETARTHVCDEHDDLNRKTDPDCAKYILRIGHELVRLCYFCVRDLQDELRTKVPDEQ